ncbi:hypothetical protein [Sphingomicrobium astaxanthinifaciens]|uniref:hypothetical protein n=1 Tax=Sphingomicrobium astaxanthinifaciens TaxID=1227949 RepID=UPI001FCA5DC3|nr:hypothetical protein [Sphingomicrobium astaxanthinifaciens]MCJ7422015.1 hypothetical protein [Sphingomicrobium astaxanthinifaciens]
MKYYDKPLGNGRHARLEELLGFDWTPRQHFPSVDRLKELTRNFEQHERFADYDARLYAKLAEAHARLREDDAFARGFYARISVHAWQVSPIVPGTVEDGDGALELKVGAKNKHLGGHPFALFSRSDGSMRTGVLAERSNCVIIITPLASEAARALASLLIRDGAQTIPLYALDPEILAPGQEHRFNRQLKYYAFEDEPV